jgi:Na+/melibiose symporter-like transporter
MKDTVLTLTARRKKHELIILAFCFVAANIVNLAAIIYFDTSWIELLTQIGYVVIITILLYFVILAFRLLLKLLFRKLRRSA